MTDERAGPLSLPRHALLTGGGSGGHVFPALAVAQALAARGWRVSYAGDAAGIEGRLVPARGFDFVPLAARPWVGRGPLAKARGAATLLGSTLAARRAIVRGGVDVVLGTGGYASVPAALGAVLARRPLLLLEPNARPGTANRRLSRWAVEAAVAYEATARELACPATTTGVPVRAEFFAVPPPPAGPARLLVLGGSQGARRLNELLPAAAGVAAGAVGGLAVLHQCGPRWLEETRARWLEAAPAGVRVEVVPFVEEVAAALAGATLVLSRAGAITLAEICAAGRPAVLVPLVLAGAHQRDNARWLEQAGAALCLEPEELDAARLGAALAELLGDGERRRGMAERARALARPGAADAIADRMNVHARRRR